MEVSLCIKAMGVLVQRNTAKVARFIILTILPVRREAKELKGKAQPKRCAEKIAELMLISMPVKLKSNRLSQGS
jgi:hypothetical protein